MFGWLGKVFGTDKAIEKGIDTLSSGLDKLVYTKEEKADDRAKSTTEARQVLIEWMRNTQGQNLARRLLALIITSIWLLMYVSSTCMDIVSIWSTDHLDDFQATADAIGSRATEMNGAMMLILGFYFAAPHMGPIVETAINRFSGKGDK